MLQNQQWNKMNTKHEIIISENDDEEMLKIYISNGFDRTGTIKEKELFYGNEWDFKRDAKSLKQFLDKLFKSLSISVSVKTNKSLKGEG